MSKLPPAAEDATAEDATAEAGAPKQGEQAGWFVTAPSSVSPLRYIGQC